MDKVMEHALSKLAEDNEFYRSLYYQWKDNGTLSDKQMAYVESAVKKMVDAAKSTVKLSEFDEI